MSHQIESAPKPGTGQPVHDLTNHDFLAEADDAPDTVHPSPWRHAQVNHHHGPFEVVPSVYQVRGFDLANITIVEGDEGIIVIDPLSGTETAQAALDLYRHGFRERHHDHGRPLEGLFASLDDFPLWLDIVQP